MPWQSNSGRIGVFLLLWASVALTGCALTEKETVKGTGDGTGERKVTAQSTRASALARDAASCKQLEMIFNESGSGFQSLRQKPDYQKKVTFWQSRYQLIEGSCQIWQWSDKFSYVCSKVFPDQESAHGIYQDAGDFINQCLGDSTVEEDRSGRSVSGNRSDWFIQQETLENRGEETRYMLGGEVRGSLRKVNTGGAFRDSWTVYFRVDSPAMLK